MSHWSHAQRVLAFLESAALAPALVPLTYKGAGVLKLLGRTSYVPAMLARLPFTSRDGSSPAPPAALLVILVGVLGLAFARGCSSSPNAAVSEEPVAMRSPSCEEKKNPS